ncbi:hypothetical protein [Thiothrix winogradskyi]|uniref:Uncharacterized protein n=1 Tax=Thiothrix winogradskyi TaxID=96472 RepID=A0ABY3SZS1_9GAMM|nr:hypothetical protein [Thiothrix winogradskyi]UJS24069.1 hypothetical protein L2Y54_19395 [Thiothrix winogradskyi]
MGDDFLLKSRDEQILSNYLKMLAFTAQEKNSDHALMVLRFKKLELRKSARKFHGENNDLVNHHLNIWQDHVDRMLAQRLQTVDDLTQQLSQAPEQKQTALAGLQQQLTQVQSVLNKLKV